MTGTRLPAHDGRDHATAPRHRVRRALVVTAVVLAVAAAVASFVTVPYEAIVPGATVNVAHLIRVPTSARHEGKGSVSLVDVDLVPLRAITYLFYKLNPDDHVVPTQQLIGAGSQATFNEQGVLDMATARTAATFVALHELGAAVHHADAGVAVYDILPGSPAAQSTVVVGDVITALSGSPAASYSALRTALSAKRPGQRVTLAVHHFGSKRTRTVTVPLGRLTGTGAAERCVPAHGVATGTACLGVVLDQLVRVEGAPYPVKLSSEGIIGPSAGLAFTLGLIEVLDTGDLTAGHRIAATGEIALDGAVGDVGGVAQKTIAVRRSGASIFFVPTQAYKIAKSHAGPEMRVFGVATIGQALRDLKSLGGQIVKDLSR